MIKHYLDLDYKTITFYEYSKTEKEGFEAAGTVGKEHFRKMYNKGVFGTLESVSLRNTDFGKRLSVRLKHGDDVYIMAYPVNSQNGQYDNRFFEPLVALLPKLSIGGAYRFYPYKIDKTFDDGKEKTFYGLSIKDANLDDFTVGEAIIPAFLKAKKDEVATAAHIPKLVFKEKLGSLKPTAASLEVKEDFFTDLLTKELERLGYVADNPQAPQAPQAPQPAQTSTGTAPKAENKPAQKKAPISNVQELDDEDDLPF